jgi:hypothetical protein
MSKRKTSLHTIFFSLKDDEEVEKYLTSIDETIQEDNNDKIATDTFIQKDIENSKMPINEEYTSDEKEQPNDEGVAPFAEGKKRKLVNRLFGKIEAGSIRGSIFNMVILSIGSGCLAIPKAMSQMSLLMGIIDIFLMAACTYWTLNMLTIASEKFQVNHYSKLVKKLYGNKVGFILDFNVLIYIFGVLILYQVISKKSY